MERRKFLFGIGTVAAGGAAAMGTGAFSAVEADRSLNVETAGDQGAYLGIDASVSEYATQTDGTVQITVDQLNDDAVTEITDVLTVSNSGDQNVHFWLDLSDVDDSLNVSAYTGNDDPDATLDGGEPKETNAGVVLGSGNEVGVSLIFGAYEGDIDGSFDGEITFYAVSGDSDLYPESGPSAGNFPEITGNN